MPTYTGGCHCKANTFSVDINPGLDAEDVKTISCNCSICNTNGYLLYFVDGADIKWGLGGPGTLKEYTYSFCDKCGTSVCVEGSMGGVTKVGLNVSVIFFDEVFC